mgnify:CR=1 FL=1
MWPFRHRSSLETHIIEFAINVMDRRIQTMSIDVTRLTDAVSASVAKTEELRASNAALTEKVAELTAKVAAAGDPVADQAAVDAQAEALAAETAKVP